MCGRSNLLETPFTIFFACAASSCGRARSGWAQNFYSIHPHIRSAFFLLCSFFDFKSLPFNPGVFDSFPYPPWRTIAVHVGVGHFSVCPLAHSMLWLSFLLFSLEFYFSFSLPLPPFLSSLHCQTEMGETWVNGQVLICHPATKESITHVSHWEWEEGWRGQLG